MPEKVKKLDFHYTYWETIFWFQIRYENQTKPDYFSKSHSLGSGFRLSGELSVWLQDPPFPDEGYTGFDYHSVFKDTRVAQSPGDHHPGSRIGSL